MEITSTRYRTDYRQLNSSNTNQGTAANSFYFRQESNNKDILELNESIRTLESSLKEFSKDGILETLYASSPTDSLYSMRLAAATQKITDAYNKVNESLKSASSVTGEGAKLLHQIQELLTGQEAAKYKKMGIEIDESTGSIKLNDRKMREFMMEEPATVKKLLMDEGYLAPTLSGLAATVLGKPAGYYFNTAFSVYI